jgi:hypothetical protein
MQGARTILCGALLSGTILFGAFHAPLVSAHHSGAMFDDKKPLTLSGTVKQFQWTNPHCWIQLMVPAEGGKSIEWSVEMGAPFEVIRTGLKPSSLKQGDKLTVVIHPMRDGSHGGLYVSATRPDGKPLTGTAK